MPKKRFDCVEMKRKGSARIYELTKDMTLAQELAFWKKSAARMRWKPKITRARSNGTRKRA